MAADRVELALASAVPAQVVIDALNGLGPVHFHRMFLDPPAERTLSTAPPADLPVFIDTGDPVADEEAHAAAKQAWLIAHPEFYNRPLPKAAR